MAKAWEDSENLCFYCDCRLRKNHEKDHVPIPTECGGEETVPTCQSRHDMKDRFPLSDWPAQWWNAVMADFPKMSRETKIFLAKVARQFSNHMMKDGVREAVQEDAAEDSSVSDQAA